MTKHIGLPTEKMELTQNITNERVTKYIHQFYRPLTPALGALRQEAEAAGVPIILKETESCLRTLLAILQPARILEIGCAVGYSAMFFAECCGAEVVTVEKDPEVYAAAVRNVRELGYEDRITILCGDGEEAVRRLKQEKTESFDLVFIDAAKSHYRRFLDASMECCGPGAVILCDNVLFKAKVADDCYDPGGRHKTNIRKMREFLEYIQQHLDMESSILAVGDGISVTKLKNGRTQAGIKNQKRKI